jgi:hypothetical protein
VKTFLHFDLTSTNKKKGIRIGTKEPLDLRTVVIKEQKSEEIGGRPHLRHPGRHHPAPHAPGRRIRSASYHSPPRPAPGAARWMCSALRVGLTAIHLGEVWLMVIRAVEIKGMRGRS